MTCASSRRSAAIASTSRSAHGWSRCRRSRPPRRRQGPHARPCRMGLLDTLAGNKDATRDWAAEPGLQLKLDLDRATLIGVPLGAKYEDLFRLGPAEDSEAAKTGDLRYLSRGVSATVTKGKV